jgi:hypothetical protein
VLLFNFTFSVYFWSDFHWSSNMSNCLFGGSPYIIWVYRWFSLSSVCQHHSQAKYDSIAFPSLVWNSHQAWRKTWLMDKSESDLIYVGHIPDKNKLESVVQRSKLEFKAHLIFQSALWTLVMLSYLILTLSANQHVGATPNKYWMNHRLAAFGIPYFDFICHRTLGPQYTTLKTVFSIMDTK